MANPKHLALLKAGVICWNNWREIDGGDETPDLSMAMLEGIDLGPIIRNEEYIGVNLLWANLYKSNLRQARLARANLKGANLNDADLNRTNLNFADLSYATLRNAFMYKALLREAISVGSDLSGAFLEEVELQEANLAQANLQGSKLDRANLADSNLENADLKGSSLERAILYQANLTHADLRKAKMIQTNLIRAEFGGAVLDGAKMKGVQLHQATLDGASMVETDLRYSTLIETKLYGTNLTGARVYGISAWDVKMDMKTMQQDLVITQFPQPVLTVDDLEVAQFLYLLSNNTKLKAVIDKITSKVVLILGNFSAERKKILDAIKNRIRAMGRGFIPVMFDFPPPENRDFTDTVKLIAHMARFIVADLSQQKSVPHELAMIAPTTAVPILPLFDVSIPENRDQPESHYSMFENFRKRYDWVLSVQKYETIETLMDALPRLVDLAENKALKWQRIGSAMPKIRAMSIIKDMNLITLSLEHDGKEIPVEFTGPPVGIPAGSEINGSAEQIDDGLWQVQLQIEKPDGTAELATRGARQKKRLM